MTLHDLDGVVADFLRSEPERSARAKWARRWFWRIDRTKAFAEKNERMTDPFGLLAIAAVTLIEAGELPEIEWEEKNRKIVEATRLVRLARGEI